MERLSEFSKKILSCKKVGIDSCLFIYMFEQNRVYEPLASVVFDAASRGKVHMVTSTLTVGEIFVKVFEKKDTMLLTIYENMFHTLPNFTLLSVDYTLASLAAHVRAKYGMRLPDAIQISAAIVAGANCFLTNDKRLQKVTDIEVVYLKDYVSKMSVEKTVSDKRLNKKF